MDALKEIFSFDFQEEMPLFLEANFRERCLAVFAHTFVVV